MKKIIYILISILLIIVFSFLFTDSSKAEEKIDIHFFFSTTCPHCIKEKAFLSNLEKDYSQIEIKAYDFSSKEAQKELENFYKKHNVKNSEKGLVPITFIENRYYVGFNEEIGEEIKNYLNELISSSNTDANKDANNYAVNTSKVKLPIVNEITLNDHSLIALAAILGFFDGFNVCSLGALVLILGIVLAFRSRAKTLIFGLAFILTTSIAYGILIFIWHNIFQIISPLISKMEILIGLISLIAALYFLWQFYITKKYGPKCQSKGLLSNLSLKLSNIFNKTNNIIILVCTIIVFALLVTIIEFPCSAAIPVLFAGIISEANLPTGLSFFYICVFLFFYMLDELIVFLIAFFTLKIWISSQKFNLWLNMIAFLALLILSIYYLLI